MTYPAITSRVVLLEDTRAVATPGPLRRYRLWNRMGAAVVACRDGGSLTEAAHAAGFASSAHFSTAFRDMFGMMPSELMKTLEPVHD